MLASEALKSCWTVSRSRSHAGSAVTGGGGTGPRFVSGVGFQFFLRAALTSLTGSVGDESVGGEQFERVHCLFFVFFGYETRPPL